MLCIDLTEHLIDPTRLLVESMLLLVEEAKKEPMPAGWKHIQRYLLPEERDNQRKDVVERMLEIFKGLPSDKEFEAAARAGQAKKGWYARSAKTLHEVFGPDTPRFAALLASTSPQVSVQENLRNSVRLWEAWIKAGRPSDPKEIDKVGAQVLGLRWTGGQTLTKDGKLKKTPGMNWNNNVLRALTAEQPEKVTLSSGGPEDNPRAGKVDSFRANLLGDLARVTNDAWMASFAGIEQQLFSSKAGYAAFSARVRRVAEKMGWQPAEVQETIWSFFKALTESSNLKNGRGREALAKMTHKDVDESSDFYDLMTSDKEVTDAIQRLRDGGFAGSASPQLRDGGQDSTESPLAAATQAGLAGDLGRIADRAEEYRRAEDIQTNATAGYSFPKATDIRISPKRVSFTLSDERDIREYNEKTRKNTLLILPSKKPGYIEVFRGARQPGAEGDKNHKETDQGHLEMLFTYDERETIKLPTSSNRQIDWDQWRNVERQRAKMIDAKRRKMAAMAKMDEPTSDGSTVPPTPEQAPQQ